MKWSPRLERHLKWISWSVVGAGSCFSLWALWLALHLKERPTDRMSILHFLGVGVLLYMVGRGMMIYRKTMQRKNREAR